MFTRKSKKDETVKEKQLVVRGRVVAERDLETATLAGDGSEKCDPISNAERLGIQPSPTLDDRVKAIMRQDFFKRNPDYGLNSENKDDFGDDESDGPMYEFERKHERLEKLRREQDEAQKEYDEALKAKQKFLREQRALKRRGHRQKEDREIAHGVSEDQPEISPDAGGTDGDGAPTKSRSRQKSGPKD